MTFATGLGVGIVGGGFMAEVHARAVRASGAQLMGVSSSSPERARIAAERIGAGRAYESIDALLDDQNIGVVHVCTPNALHAEQAAAVIESGRDVVCEKPLATLSSDAAAITAAASDAGVTATVPFVYRFHPMVREARARFAAGDAGRLLTFTASYLQDWLLDASDDNWRVDAAAGGRSRAFGDIGSHLVDLVEFVTGDRVVRVAATAKTFIADRAQNHEVTTEDAVAATVVTASGAIGTLLVSQLAPGRKNRLHLEIAGDVESLAFDQEHPETLWIGRRAGSVLLPRDAGQLAPDAARLVSVPAGHPQGYQDAFNAFVADSYAAGRGEEPDGLPRFADGLRASLVTEAVLDASDSGSWIDVPSATPATALT